VGSHAERECYKGGNGQKKRGQGRLERAACVRTPDPKTLEVRKGCERSKEKEVPGKVRLQFPRITGEGGREGDKPHTPCCGEYSMRENPRCGRRSRYIGRRGGLDEGVESKREGVFLRLAEEG